MTPSIQKYLERRRLREIAAWQPRPMCDRCKNPRLTCYCAHLRPFTPRTRFVILMHPSETGRRVASGKMTYHCLTNAVLLEGENFSQNETLAQLLTDPHLYPVLLFPGTASRNISQMSAAERRNSFPPDKQLTVIVLDGTWAEAKRMARLSSCLHHLPRVCFTPPQSSRFLIRKQPSEHCYASIEAVHHFLELTEGKSREHETLLDVFSFMVNQQIEFEKTHSVSRHRFFSQRKQARREKNAR